MRTNPLFQKFSAILLLGIFLFCNTPTRILHHLFANHADDPVELKSHSNSPVFQEAGIDCHLISNVVTAPYVFEYEPVTFEQPAIYRLYTTPEIHSHYPTFTPWFSLRGPPLLS